MVAPEQLNAAGSIVEAEGRTPIPLRLTAARGQLGLELYEPLLLSPLQVSALTLTLPNLRFPVDLSGGVHAFRHRRGSLQHLQVRVTYRELLRCVKRICGQLWSDSEPEHTRVWLAKDTLHVGLLWDRGALAFDVLWAPDEGAARLIVDNARGAVEGGVPLALALQLMDALLGPAASRQGRVFTVPKLGATLGQFIFPLLGARVPATNQARVSLLRGDAEGFGCTLDPSLTTPALSEHVLRRIELSTLTGAGDDALFLGDLDRAREGYLLALEQAPRHPQLAQAIAEIDAAVGGRNEAALGLLKENVPLRSAGALAGELLAPWDMPLAREAFEHAILNEPYAPLAACWVARLAELEPEPRAKLDALDRAVALAPTLRRVRQARITARATLGDVQAVLTDAQHLEAATQGSEQRHRLLCQVARTLLEQGWVRDAGKVFERALRYLPDDPDATAGLARSFQASGQPRRAIALLERAVALEQKAGKMSPDALLDLAQIIAQELLDLPQAVARVRQVRFDSPRAHEARALEAQWLAELGDVSGASLAYARLRETLAVSELVDVERAASWLLKAAHFARTQRDLAAAESHLALALRLAPRDPQVQVEYRQAAQDLAFSRRAERDSSR
jgi:tetratricopeptide (TPR) repeat protein